MNFNLLIDDELPKELANNISNDVSDYLPWVTYKIKMVRTDVPIRIAWLIKQVTLKKLYAFKCAIRKLVDEAGTEETYFVIAVAAPRAFNFEALYVKAVPCKLTIRSMAIMPIRLQIHFKASSFNCSKCNNRMIDQLGCYVCNGLFSNLVKLIEFSDSPALTLEQVNQQMFAHLDVQCNECQIKGLQCHHLLAPPARL